MTRQDSTGCIDDTGQILSSGGAGRRGGCPGSSRCTLIVSPIFSVIGYGYEDVATAGVQMQNAEKGVSKVRREKVPVMSVC